MNVHNILSHGDTTKCLIWYAYVKEQRRSYQYQIHGENINFDIEAKGQGHAEVMKLCDTSSYGDTLMCHIWYDYVNREKALTLTQSHVKTL